jgi:hypothetical protein
MSNVDTSTSLVHPINDASVADPSFNAVTDAIKMPSHAIYVRWQFVEPMTTLEFDITIHSDPGIETGLYLSPFNGSIDGAKIYFGLQTNLNKPVDSQFGSGQVTNVGKGLLFSTWWTFDANDARVADETGFYQLGTHEGRFLGIRREYQWTPGSYRLRLSRGDVGLDNASDWFDLSMQPLQTRSANQLATRAFGTQTEPLNRPAPVGDETWIGALRFNRTNAAIPATISSKGTGFVEVYSGAPRFVDVPKWHIDLQAYGDGQRAVSATSEYPHFPRDQRAPNADVHFNAEQDRVHMTFGADTQRRHEAGPLFS